MITFKNFLSESMSRAISLEVALPLIARDCKEFFQQSNELPLYRGIKIKSDMLVHELPHPVNRLAKDSDSTFNKIFNDAIDHVFSIEKIRTKTVFASGDQIQASAYGRLYFFFPKGKFNFMWSPSIIDSFEDFDAMCEIGISSVCEQFHLHRDVVNTIQIKNLFKSYASLFGEHDNMCDTSKLSESDKTWLLNYARGAISHYTLRALEENEVELTDFMSNVLIHAVEKGYDLNGSLANAIESHSEIFFFQTDGYYVVPVDEAVRMAQESGLLSAYDSLDRSATYKTFLELLKKSA